MRNPELHRSIRASFGFVLVLVSQWLPWAEGGNLWRRLQLPLESHTRILGIDAWVDAGSMTIPIWVVAVLTGWLVAMSWLSQAKLLMPNIPLVFALHGASLVLLLSWLVKVNENGAFMGVGFITASVGVAFALKAVQVDYGEVPAAAATESSAVPAPEAQA